jgi:voltage-gated potassium channel
MVFFTVEYAIRVWTADLLYPHSKVPRLRFVSSPGAVIDLLSFLPFYLTGLIPAGMVVFRLIRVARILRIFRINRYSDPISAILDVFRRKASLIFASIFLVMVLMLGASLLMYYAEHDAQPSVFENAFSGLWWAVSTLSTTGYGDIYPVTLLGKTLAIVITLLGMSVVALPTGIITAGFMEAAGQEETLKIILPDGTEAVSGSAPAGTKPEKNSAKAGKNRKEKGSGKSGQMIQAEENPRFVLRTKRGDIVIEIRDERT